MCQFHSNPVTRPAPRWLPVVISILIQCGSFERQNFLLDLFQELFARSSGPDRAITRKNLDDPASVY